MNLRSGLPTLAALAVIAAAYSNVGGGTYVWDDRPLIVDQPAVHDVTPARFFSQPFWQPSPFGEGHAVYYRPLTTLSYAWDWVAGRGSPARFHYVNVALHLLACGLVSALAMVLGASPRAAAIGTAVFGTFPRLTESVSWISGRTDVLAGLLAIAALAVHLSGPERLARRVVAALLVLAGLFAKEVAVAAAAGIVAAELARGGMSGLRSMAARMGPMVAAVLAYGAVRLQALHSLPRLPPGTEPGAARRMMLALEALGRYAAMIADPLRPRLQIGDVGHLDLGFAALGAGVASVLALAARRARHRFAPATIAVGITAILALSLVLHLAPIRIAVVAADRFLYLPMAAICPLVAARSTRLSRRSQLALACAALVTTPFFAVASYRRTTEWNDEIVLWRRAVETTPTSNPLPLHDYGSALARAGRFDEAIAAYERAAESTTGRRRVSALVDVATTLSDRGDVDVAVERMRAAMALGPTVPSQHYNLAILEARRTRFDIAESELERAVAMLPTYEAARQAIGWVREMRHRWDALPPPRESEPTSILARRAAIFADLGVPSRAAPMWKVVSAAPDADPDELLAAALFQVRQGAVADARATLARARIVGADERRFALVQAAVDATTGERGR